MTRKFASFVRFSRLNTIMKRTLLLIYFTIIFITSVSAQLYQYLDTNDGLSSRRVLSIQKDNKGYMWFLTHEGIDRYNGKQYVHYSLSADGQPNMKSFSQPEYFGNRYSRRNLGNRKKTDIFLSTIHYKTNTSWPIILPAKTKATVGFHSSALIWTTKTIFGFVPKTNNTFLISTRKN